MAERFPFRTTFDASAKRVEFEDGSVLDVASGAFGNSFNATIDKHDGATVDGHRPASATYSVTPSPAPSQNKAVRWTVPVEVAGQPPLKLYDNPLYPNIDGWRPTDQSVRLAGSEAVTDQREFTTLEIVEL